MSAAMGNNEFARAMGPVAREILGEPTQATLTELRFGTRGSLSIQLDRGVWQDHETGDGGGVLKFIQQRKQLDKAGAIAWLAERGYILKSPSPKAKSGRRIVATYDYPDEHGELLFQVVRYHPKDFRQRRPDGNGGWIAEKGCMKGVPLVLYRLPDIIAAVAERRTIYIAEGEKGVHALKSIGLVGTNSPGGAGKWRREYCKKLAGADVVVLPDNDPQTVNNDGTPRWHPDGRPVLAGQDHAAEIAAQLHGVARRVRVIMLPDLPLKGDVADWIEAGGTSDQLEDLAARAPDWTPPPKSKAAKPEVNTNEDDPVAAAVAQLNEQYMVVIDGGKTKVYREVHDPILNRRYFSRMGFDDFRKLYLNRTIRVPKGDGETTPKKVAEIWLHHPNRRQFIGGMIFDPSSQHLKPDQLNLWRGFGVTEAAGSWLLMQQHIKEIVCCCREDDYAYVLNWMARLVQDPAKQGEVAIVMKGDEGCGKGILARALRHILGQHGMHISHTKHLTGNFNVHLRDTAFLFADEAFYAGDVANVGVLKALITEPVLCIEGKGVDMVLAANCLHIMMASNNEWVVPASLQARRFLVLQCSDSRIGDIPYFAALQAELEAGGYEAMLYDLRRRNITDFNVRTVPDTEGLQEQKKLSLPIPEAWWMDVLHRGYVWKSKLGLEDIFAEWRDFVSTDLLYRSYTEFAEQHRDRHMMAREAFGKFMGKMGASPAKKRHGVVGEHMIDVPIDQSGNNTRRQTEVVRHKERANGYRVGSTLAIAQAAFVNNTKLSIRWDEGGDELAED